MTISDRPDSDAVAKLARDTFLKIRELNKTMPKRTARERQELEDKIKELKDQWWQEASKYIVKIT